MTVLFMKYLISLYFDDSTNKQIYKHMENVAKATGNDYMLVGHVPPHITISSFETEDVDEVRLAIQECLAGVKAEELQWVGTGAFMTSVLYLTPVLSEYLQSLMQAAYDCICINPKVKISKYYQPFQWLPHTTIGKKMNETELVEGFRVVQKEFQMIQGRAVRIGLAKASPYEDIFNIFLS